MKAQGDPNPPCLPMVDEMSTTAAAATFFKPLSILPAVRIPAQKFVADHPFMFVLTKNSNPLFMGHFA
ncbi:hypothetical protein Aduo_017444 [Ancylostoma duodenale]